MGSEDSRAPFFMDGVGVRPRPSGALGWLRRPRNSGYTPNHQNTPREKGKPPKAGEKRTVLGSLFGPILREEQNNQRILAMTALFN